MSTVKYDEHGKPTSKLEPSAYSLVSPSHGDQKAYSKSSDKRK